MDVDDVINPLPPLPTDPVSYPQISTVPDPIRLQGVGSTTIFGLNNRFSMDYPTVLNGKVAEEEFQKTVYRINRILQYEISQNVKWLLCGCFCCCCTLGISMGPAIILSRNTRNKVQKELSYENVRLYHKIGLHWKLEKESLDDSHLRHYVLVLEFLPKEPILYPD
ncbi:Cysteine-rich hydrophobic domain-containing protein 2-like [Oopsacas minuta]|uniref:Cysteine-rich hydrophobic domain-containing protein 2-like n=1 Tax=Oopsacas minuta TaxID=111878 RepID=A0AAV7JEU3_9METZ|nr:Cysteine-rich hydrophobic domain-containing protein 2-like [Oopsacas minuta]